MMNNTDRYTPEEVTYSVDTDGTMKFRIKVDGKWYKMMIASDTWNGLETEPGELIRFLTAVEPGDVSWKSDSNKPILARVNLDIQPE